MNDDKIQNQYFTEILLFFQEFQWLYNMPVTQILFEGSLDLLPYDWMETLKNLENSELNNFVVKAEIQTTWPASLINFVNNCKKFNKLPDPILALPCIQLPQAFTKKLNIKKQHEIVHLARLVHEQCSVQNISLIVDLGAGLGYICQLLNYLYGYQVLGLESNPQNVETAKIRQKTLFSDSLPFVKYICCNITMDSSKYIESILQQEFNETKSVCLIGLHACGDLSVYMSQIYLEMKKAQLFILVSCCYHKLTLVENKTENKDNEYFNYFPLSEALKNARCNMNLAVENYFRRPFMRLACQETSERWISMTEKSHEEHSFYVLARAVLELYGMQNGLSLRKLVQKGTRKSQCTDFENYLKDSMRRYVYEKKVISNEKLSLSTISWSDKIKNEIIQLWESNMEKLKSIEIYTALQFLLQHAAESLVVFDRLYFLKEHNYKASIIPIANRSLSPRCYAMVSRN